MILWRAVQGFLGAGMIPTVFASAYTVFPRSKFYIVGPIIGLVATLAPTIGPTVGGYITDMMSWHWLFFINIIPGIGITIGVLALVDFDQPNFALLDRFDWWGLIFMAGFLGSLEYVLEEGPQYEWLQDTSVAIFAAVCAVLRQGIFVVCDGMGGQQAGELASKIAVDTVLGLMDPHGRIGYVLGCK